MRQYRNHWLSHLKDRVPKSAHGVSSCMYLMALEGWRRGFDLKFIFKNTGSRKILSNVGFVLDDGYRQHTFYGSRGDKVSSEAINLCRKKSLTNQCLHDQNVSIPKGGAFPHESDNNEILEFARKIGYPLVLKPSDSDGGGVGVKTNIKDEAEMLQALIDIRDHLTNKSVIVEQYFIGQDFRVYVLDGKVEGAFIRRPLSILADGKNNISDLLLEKNKIMNQSPFLAKKKLKVDQDMIDFLNEKGLTPESIPEKGERIYLRRNGEYFGQRDAVEYTDQLSDEMKQIAIDAVQAIPGLPHGGVDMLIDLENNVGVVNEVNSRPQISNHVFPYEGQAIDIPKKIIDYYFPESKDDVLTNIKYYFDFRPIIKNNKSQNKDEIKIPPMPIGLKSGKRYLIKGDVLDQEFLKNIKGKAKYRNLSGYVRPSGKNSISVVVFGSDRLVNNFKGAIQRSAPEHVQIEKITAEQYKQTVKVGFDVRKNPKVPIPEQPTKPEVTQNENRNFSKARIKKAIKKLIK